MPADEDEDRGKTRERFRDALKKYTESDHKKKDKKEKKKNPESRETVALQTLKKNLNLEKNTEEDETILQNTYKPEYSFRYTKNKRRERDVAEKVNNSINQEEVATSKGKRKSKRELPSLPVCEDATTLTKKDADASKSEITADLDVVTVPKRRSKKGKGKGDTEVTTASQVKDTEDHLLHEYQHHIAQEEEEEERTLKKTKVKTDEGSSASHHITLNNDVGKKKKKKLKSVVTDSDAGDQDEAADPKTDEGNETECREGKKKKKKKKNQETEAETQEKPVFDDSLVLGVHVHRSECLRTDPFISHPMVKVHVVDELTGQYLGKEDSHRQVSSFYEHDRVGHILPIMTQPFDFMKNKSIIPEWQEQIVFNERFGYFIQQNDHGPRVILFFEILDFVSMEEARANVDADEHDRGFRKIAWAFLKLDGTNGNLNIDSQFRLQLFFPPLRAKRRAGTVEVVEWWRKYPRNKYPSTLYVTVKGIKLPEHVDPSIRSMMALQEERGSTSYSELQDQTTERSLPQPSQTESKPPVQWNRLPGQVCRVPNKPFLAFRGGQMGCFTVLFSHDGTLLAAACADRDTFPVVVYEIPSGKVLAAFNGHLKIVYDLCWSRDDRNLLSASSDGTVREWNVERLSAAAQKVLPHPSFVYSAQYHPTAQNLVVSGGYDSLVRVWRLDVSDVNGQLLQAFEGHSSFINSICFDSEGTRMFSADNAGQIIEWKTGKKSANGGEQQLPCHRWRIKEKIAESDLSGVPINKLQLHPNGHCLLIHPKSRVLRTMDLRILAVRKYTGATNYRERIYSTFTPCGNFIFSGSEDGMAYVWNTDTGDQVAVYSELRYRTALHGVAFHPHENMAAFCAFGENEPIHVYLFEHKASQTEGHAVKAASRSASADTVSDPHFFQDTSAPSVVDLLVHTRQLKLQCVKEKLDSVLTPLRASSLPACLPSARSKLQPEPFIPQAASTQIRESSPVGQSLKVTSSFRRQTTLPGVEADSAPAHFVVALYDYDSTRSDELTVRRDDVIQVLYKDNDTWWFGRLADGRQGYFPASHVADEKESVDEATQPAAEHTAPSEKAERSTPTRVSATISPSGELRFLSEPALSDTEPELTGPKARRKKKVKRPGPPPPSSQATFSDAEAPASTGSRRRLRPLPKRPGQTNGAFEPDT